jgi:transcriptional regulator with XRE-family HTH domain
MTDLTITPDLVPQVDPHKLRAVRIKAKLELRHLAVALRVSTPQVANIESGYSRIRAEHLAVWGRTCGVKNLFDLYTDTTPNAFLHERLQARKTA